MKEIIQTMDWMALITAVWTVILVPVGRQIYEWLKTKKLDKYAGILYGELTKAVKSVYETTVKDIKGTEGWTLEKQNEVRELAKIKTVQALSASALKMMKRANADFDDWLDSLVGTALYDIKHESEKERGKDYENQCTCRTQSGREEGLRSSRADSGVDGGPEG